MPSSIMNVSVANVTIRSWNSMEVVGKYLVLQRASVGVKQGMANQPHYRFPEIPRQNVPLGMQGSSLPVYLDPQRPDKCVELIDVLKFVGQSLIAMVLNEGSQTTLPLKLICSP